MVKAHSLLQILSSPGAIAQDLDGAFFVFTNGGSENSPSFPGIFTPHFFDLSVSWWRTFAGCQKWTRQELLQAIETIGFQSPLGGAIAWSPADRKSFDRDFESIHHALAEGSLEKAVLMTAETSSWTPNSEERLRLLWNLLRHSPPHLFIYGHWTEDSGVLGATPELLFVRQGLQLSSMALAGTLAKEERRSVEELKQQLLNDPKERHEHQLVVDDLTEKMKRASVVGPQVLGPQVLELPRLLHLHTAIEASLPPEISLSPALSKEAFEQSFDYDLIQNLHPSSALGLRSRQTPWVWLKNLEGHHDLGHFGAPFGLKTPSGFLCLVGIRNLEWRPGLAKIQAGCGVVPLSHADREWEELRAKRDSVKALLGL